MGSGIFWRAQGHIETFVAMQELPIEAIGNVKYDWDNVDWKSNLLSEDETVLLHTTRVNRDLEAEAYREWIASKTSRDICLGQKLGELMTRHHEALRDGLQLSTVMLEKMNVAAMQAGAWGFKVVGSGGGGCGVAWTSAEKAQAVQSALVSVGVPTSWIITEASVGASIQVQ